MEPRDVVEAGQKWKPTQNGFPALRLNEPRLAARVERFYAQLGVPEQLENRQGWSRR